MTSIDQPPHRRFPYFTVENYYDEAYDYAVLVERPRPDRAAAIAR
jgi:hypothetical protein